METIGYLASIVIGIVLGLLGGGGSILSIPILVYLFQIDVVMAAAYSLFIVGVTSFVGAIPKYKHHLVNVKTGILFGIPSVLSIFVTRKWIVSAIPEILIQTEVFTLNKRNFLLGVFALLMVLASISMIRGKKSENTFEDHRFKFFLLILEGSFVGLLTGLVGAGGGFLIIPALVFLTGLKFKTAVGSSLFIISLNSLMGFFGDLMNYTIDWKLLLPITGLAVTGIFIGNFFSKRLEGILLRKLFGWFVLLMGLYILTKEFSNHQNK